MSTDLDHPALPETAGGSSLAELRAAIVRAEQDELDRADLPGACHELADAEAAVARARDKRTRAELAEREARERAEQARLARNVRVRELLARSVEPGAIAAASGLSRSYVAELGRDLTPDAG